MAKAIWNGVVIAEAAEIVHVDGYPYFPRAGLKEEFFRESAHTSACAWKGAANYFDLVVGDQVNAEAAWVYREPKPAARHIAGMVGFWKGIKVVP